MNRKQGTNISNRKWLIICFICHNTGHFAKHCKNNTCGLSKETQEKRYKIKSRGQRNIRSVNKVPQGNMWRINPYYKDSKEIHISSMSEASKDDDEKNNAIDKNDIHSEGNQDEM